MLSQQARCQHPPKHRLSLHFARSMLILLPMARIDSRYAGHFLKK